MMKNRRRFTFIAAVLFLSGAPLHHARAQTAPAVEAAYSAILADPKVVKTLDDIKADDGRALAEQKRITEISAPPYKEKARAAYFLKRFQGSASRMPRSTPRAT